MEHASTRFWQAVCVAAALFAPGAFQPLRADYPEKPVRIVVPFAPGGGTDLVARTLAVGLAQELGQPIVIDNKPGAGTIIGTDHVAKSAPDGYTIVIATFAHAVNPSLQPKLPFDTARAFAPVILIGRSHNTLVVKADSKFKSVGDILAAARAEPGKLTFASQGIGTSAHLAGELFKNLAKLDLTHVPYKGAGPALQDLLGGRIDIMFATAAAVGGHISGGRLRAVAVTSPAGASPVPGVPTVADGGVAGYVVESWYGLYVPAGTPAAIVARLNAATRKAAQADAFRKRVEEEGLVISAGPPQELERYVAGEEARWRKIVIENKITPE